MSFLKKLQESQVVVQQGAFLFEVEDDTTSKYSKSETVNSTCDSNPTVQAEREVHGTADHCLGEALRGNLHVFLVEADSVPEECLAVHDKETAVVCSVSPPVCAVSSQALRTQVEARGTFEEGQPSFQVLLLEQKMRMRNLSFWVAAASQLAREGLVEDIGVSFCTTAQLESAIHAAKASQHRISVVRVHLSLLNVNEPETAALRRLCESEGIALLCEGWEQATLGMGDCDPPVEEARGVWSLVESEAVSRLHEGIRKVARSRGKAVRDVVLRWTVQKGLFPVVRCLSEAGVRKVRAALEWRLEDSEMEALDACAPPASAFASPRPLHGWSIIAMPLLLFRAPFVILWHGGVALGAVWQRFLEALTHSPAESGRLDRYLEAAGVGGEADDEGVTVVYCSGWTPPYLHMTSNSLEEGPGTGGEWTVAPGVPMVPSSRLPGFLGEGTVWELSVRGASRLEFVPNDGNGKWDKAPGNRNYCVETPGVFFLRDGTLEPLEPAPLAPENLEVIQKGPSFVGLRWSPPCGEKRKTRFRLYLDGLPVTETEEGVCEGRASGLTASTTFRFAVTAVTSQGVEGPLSAFVSVKTGPPGPPGRPRFVRVDEERADRVTISWECPEDTGGVPVSRYRIYRDDEEVGEIQTGRPASADAGAGSGSPAPCLWHPRLQWTDTGVIEGENFRYTLTACRGPLQSDASEAVETTAANPLVVPRLGDGRPHVMLQAFHWGSCHVRGRGGDSSWYSIVLQHLDTVTEAGVSMLWLPPPCQSADAHGYLPSGWYNLDSNYGSREELLKVLKKARTQGVAPVLDLVANHRCADAQDEKGEWSVYRQEPSWGKWAICSNDPNVRGEGRPSNFENIKYAPNLDHSNPQIQADTRSWLSWLCSREVGFAALRLDYVIGYCPGLQAQYVESVGAPFAVAENWNGDPQVLNSYVRSARGRVAVFDFPTYYSLKGAVGRNDFAGLRRADGKPQGIIGDDPARAVTFVENHDTSHLEIVGGPFGDAHQVLRGYAYILTHPGTPCVFWPDLFDRGREASEKILSLIRLRTSLGIHAQSGVFVDVARLGLYAAFVSSRHQNCQRGGGDLAVKIGSDDWAPGGGGWSVAACGHHWAVWRRG
uniref:Fibronectin type-III domain-containing protein n=1 Tax=Chromera velia CCMP2878 TaxID=1169474 RepID=A0A0G4HJ74_9ALVE|eukprot:Cvel_1082.t1-p1 / transcript=Cvel_1082.t1 / gene=Cvel_1082 / organism=Chromera_velia_CCMP2878 / gene_product=Alpha-amylase AMY3, putative / transcript_product=Alpha-amylase AMY3, putative / location=Cvel_scaffold35:60893-66178(-) / protein_length=1110 / sequence_SO=supercontig / SO=protein_coding / is_pseudo=false